MRILLGVILSAVLSCAASAQPRLPPNVLFGVNMTGAEFPTPTLPTTGDFAYLQSVGVKFVRLATAWENWATTPGGSLQATYLANVKTTLARANAHGIKVLIDVHDYASYVQSTNWGTGSPSYTNPGNGGAVGTGVNKIGDGTLTQANLVTLWTNIATALKGTPGLGGYDTMNEPYGVIGTNLFPLPNAFGDPNSSWFASQAAVVTQLALGTNPIAGYSPAWSVTGGSGFGSISQDVTLGSGAYAVSVYAKTATTAPGDLYIGGGGVTITANSSWRRFVYSATPGAGSTQIQFYVENSGDTIDFSNAQIELTAATCTTCSISGATLTTGGTITGTFAIGQDIAVANVVEAKIISGSGSTWTLNTSPGDVSSVAMIAVADYVPSTWLPVAQAVVSGIRSVDNVTPIYVEGDNGANAFSWQYASYEFSTIIGTGVVFEAHQYFDTSLSSGFGGGTYSGTFTSYSIPTTAGVTWITPFTSWLSLTGKKGFIGEYGIPNSATDANEQWFPLAGQVLQRLRQQNIPATMWGYGNAGIDFAGVLQLNPSGNNDPRVIQLRSN